MPYVTSIERIAQERGIKQGIEQGIEQGIRIGKIELFCGLLDEPALDPVALKQQSVESLQQLCESLQARLKSRQ